MQAQFWHNAWEQGKTGWQQRSVNSRLQQQWPALGLPAGAKVLVPLCGDSIDMMWLLEQGCQVIGSELSEAAVEQFFENNFSGRGLEASKSQEAGQTVFKAEGVTVYCGDFFSLTAAQVGNIDAAYDRGATVAMSPELRPAYATKMHELLPSGATSMLIAWEYDEQKMDGPPFSISREEADRLYAGGFEISVMCTQSGPEYLGNLADRGLDTLTENVYRMVRR